MLSAHSSYSELFENDSPEFIEALRTTIFPGEVPAMLNNARPPTELKKRQSQGIEMLADLSQQLTKRLSQATTVCDEDEFDHQEPPLKRKKNSGEQEFIEGSSSEPLDQTASKPEMKDQDEVDNIPNAMTHGKSASTAEPLHATTDSVSSEAAARIPGYAPDKVNVYASRLMRNPEFRATRTSAAGSDFIDGFYKNSRLHHLSTWKTELRALVAEAQERADKAFACGDRARDSGSSARGSDKNKVAEDGLVGKVDAESMTSTSMRGNAFQLLRPPSKKGKAEEQESIGSEDTVIMHCDFDCFFASVGLLSRPYLKDQPVVVCHSQGNQGRESSTSEVSSANYKARESGIRAGMSLQQARKLCPSIVTIPYEFEKYKAASLHLYTILMSHADDLQAVSVDEALVDVTTAVGQMPPSSEKGYDPAKAFAEMLRGEIKSAAGCNVSIGISHNIMLARLATRKAKPAGSYHLRLADLQKHIENTCIDELHGFGRAARDKALERLGAATLGEIAKKPRSVLCDVFGKTNGTILYDACRGIDHRKLESDKPRRSVSAEINYGIRFENNEQVQAFMFQLADEVARRLDAIDMRGRLLTLKIMKRDSDAPVEPPKFLGHGCCNVFNKQANLSSEGGRAISDALIIGQVAWRLLKGFAFDPRDLRGVGIQITKLEKASETSSRSELGQTKLEFRKVKKLSQEKKEHKETKGEDNKDSGPAVSGSEESTPPTLTVQPPSSQSQHSNEAQEIKPKTELPVEGVASNLVLPSFSQVDRLSFEALPETLKNEIKAEYSRRSASPALSALSDVDADPNRMRSLSPPRKKRTTNKGTPLSRITQALAPRSRDGSSRSGVSAGLMKQSIFERCVNEKEARGTRVVVTREELKKLGIDARVFYELPSGVQLEQLASARFARSFGKKEKGAKETKKSI